MGSFPTPAWQTHEDNYDYHVAPGFSPLNRKQFFELLDLGQAPGVHWGTNASVLNILNQLGEVGLSLFGIEKLKTQESK